MTGDFFEIPEMRRLFVSVVPCTGCSPFRSALTAVTAVCIRDSHDAIVDDFDRLAGLFPCFCCPQTHGSAGAVLPVSDSANHHYRCRSVCLSRATAHKKSSVWVMTSRGGVADTLRRP
jgi:hypothetical protein